MDKLVFIVEMKADDEDALEYLKNLRHTYLMITNLAAYGYTDDERIATSYIGIDDKLIL